MESGRSDFHLALVDDPSSPDLVEEMRARVLVGIEHLRTGDERSSGEKCLLRGRETAVRDKESDLWVAQQRVLIHKRTNEQRVALFELRNDVGGKHSLKALFDRPNDTKSGCSENKRVSHHCDLFLVPIAVGSNANKY